MIDVNQFMLNDAQTVTQIFLCFRFDPSSGISQKYWSHE